MESRKRRKIEIENASSSSSFTEKKFAMTNSSSFAVFSNNSEKIMTFDTEREALLFCLYKTFKKNQKFFDFEKIWQLSQSDMEALLSKEGQNLPTEKRFSPRKLNKVTSENLLLKLTNQTDSQKMEIDQQNEQESPQKNDRKRKRSEEQLNEISNEILTSSSIMNSFPSETPETQILDTIFETELNYCEGNSKRKDYFHSKQIFEKLAMKKHQPSRFYLGFLNSFRFFGSTNQTKGKRMIQASSKDAIKFFEMKCGNSDDIGHCNQKNYLFLLGVCYELGHGCQKNAKKAFSLYNRSAELGNPQALLNLGAYHALGLYVPQNTSKTVNCMKTAAEMGSLLACMSLGQAYFEGKYVKEDLSQAKKYFKKAAEAGFPPAMQLMATVLDSQANGNEEIKEKVIQYTKQAAAQGEYLSQARLALTHFLGDTEHKMNDEKWLHYSKLASRSEMPLCDFWLGLGYSKTPLKNGKLANLYFQRAAEGSIEAREKLTFMAEDGKAEKRNFFEEDY